MTKVPYSETVQCVGCGAAIPSGWWQCEWCNRRDRERSRVNNVPRQHI